MRGDRGRSLARVAARAGHARHHVTYHQAPEDWIDRWSTQKRDMAARIAATDRQTQQPTQQAASSTAEAKIAQTIAAGRLQPVCGKQKERDPLGLQPLPQRKKKRTSAVFEKPTREPAAAGAAWRQKWPAALLVSADEMLHECGLGGLEDMSPADRDGYLRDTLWEAREYDPAAFREPARRPSAAARSWRQAYPSALLEAADETCEESELGSLDSMDPDERQVFLRELRDMIEGY